MIIYSDTTGVDVDFRGKTMYSAVCFSCRWTYILETDGFSICSYCGSPLTLNIGIAFKVDLTFLIDQENWVAKNKERLSEYEISKFLEENKQRVIADFLL